MADASKNARKISILQMFVALFDRYGQASLKDPRRQPQTIAGVLVTVVFSFIAAALIIISITKLVEQNTFIRLGGRAQLNGIYQIMSGGNDSDVRFQTWEYFYIPSLELQFDSKVIFFQRHDDQRPIFKVEVKDRNGYHPTFTSDTRSSPAGLALRSKHQVPMNSFDNSLDQKLNPKISGIKVNLEDKLYFANVITASESLQILRGLSSGKLGSTGEFQDHEVTFFVRFNKDQLSKLKKCQLQVLLYSEGQFSELADRGLIQDRTFIQKNIFSGQNSSRLTWLPPSENSLKLDTDDVSMLIMKAAVSNASLEAFYDALDCLDDGTACGVIEKNTLRMMDWSYVINYVNNFNHTFTKHSCRDKTIFRTDFITRVPTERLTDTTLSLDWSDTIVWPFVPFSIVVQGWGKHERMLVTNYNVESVFTNDTNSTERRAVFTVKRSAEARARVPNNVLLLAKSPLEETGPSRTWHCPYYWYGDGNCNCECGGVDVDCLADPVAVSGCEGHRAFGAFCDLDARCTSRLETTLSVSEGCDGDGLRLKGESMRVGLQGDNIELQSLRGSDSVVENTCVPCPGDALFLQMPRVYGSEEELVCSPPAKAWISADLNSPGDGGSNPLRWGVTYIAPDASGDLMVKVGAVMQRELMIPDPSTNPLAPKKGFLARLSVGERLQEMVRLLKVEDLGFGLASLTLRREPPGNAREGSLAFRNQSLLFDDGDLCEYGLIGELVSTIFSDTRKVQVLLPRNVMQVHSELVKTGYYFPMVSAHPATASVSAFEFQINGYTMHASQVSRLEEVTWDGTRRYIQTVFLEAPPRFTVGTEAFVKGDYASGTTEIQVYGKAMLASIAGMDLSTPPLPKVHVLGNKERMSFRVTKVQIEESSNPQVDGVVGTLTFNRALTSAIMDGDLLFLTTDPRNVGLNVTNARFFGCDRPEVMHVYAMQTLDILVDGEPYSPDTRYQSTSHEPQPSPPVLHIETALFLQANLQNPTDAQPLCPNISDPRPPVPAQRFNQKGWDQWSVFRNASVTGCTLITNPPEVCSSAREGGGDLEDVCPEIMPPSSVMTFQYHFPVNNKWKTKFPIADRNIINDPEYLMDVVFDYHMTYDNANVKTEKRFNENQPGEGDTFKGADNKILKNFFAGSLGYLGRPNSSGVDARLGDLVPSTLPVLANKVVLKTALHALEDVTRSQDNGGAINWPWKNGDAQKKLLEGLDPLEIEFDLASLGTASGSAKGVPLAPGFEYRFEAFVRIEPQLEVASFGGSQVYAWILQVVRKSASAKPLAPDEPQNIAKVRYTVSIDSTAMSSMQVVAYPWTLGIVGIVSAVLYLYIGLCALVPIQRFMHWNTYIHRPDNPQAKQPKYLKDLFERIKELKTDK